jgi:tetratricopeptide (TPR) repeat protein
MTHASFGPLPHRYAHRSAMAVVLWYLTTAAFAQSQDVTCGSLENSYGPFDYRTDRGSKLHIVEAYHFTPEVEALIKADTGYIGADLDYTLRAYPNHHRALVSAMRFGEKTKSPMPPNMKYSVECYFERALRFRPDDTVARMLYATFLQKNRRIEESNVQLERASNDAKENGFTHYNIGLIYFDGKNFDKALTEAQRAITLGFPRQELKDRLIAIGKWREPPSATPASATSAPSPKGTASAAHQ